ncbi:MAG: hypothetical protein ACPG2Y_00090 [Acholeplasmataceae bacterium]
MSASPQVNKVDLLKQQYQDAVRAVTKENDKYCGIVSKLNANLTERSNAAASIPNNQQRKLFLQLNALNIWLLKSNIHMVDADDAGRVWMPNIVDEQGDVAFMDCKDKDNKSPELIELTNFFDEMRSEWMHEYFVKFAQANESRDKQNELCEETDEKS